MATVLRSWDSPSSRAAATVSANDAINGWMKRYGQERQNRRLKRQVQQTSFAVRSWAARATGRAKAYEAYGTGLERQGASLQAQSQDVARQQARMQALNAAWEQRLQGADTRPEQRRLRRQYRREYGSHEAVLKGMTEQYESGASTYEAQRGRLDAYKKRYKAGTERYERAVVRNERAVERFNEGYYPVRSGLSY